MVIALWAWAAMVAIVSGVAIARRLRMRPTPATEPVSVLLVRPCKGAEPSLQGRLETIGQWPSPPTVRFSVTDRPGDWGGLYDRIIADVEADGGLTVLGLERGSEGVYRRANETMIDLASRLAVEGDPPRVCIVWEGSEREGDVSNDLAESGRERGWPVDEVLTVRKT